MLSTDRIVDELMDRINLLAPRCEPVSYIRVISINIRAEVIDELLICTHFLQIAAKMSRDLASIFIKK
ncbi:MAG: hypothetical protein ACE5OQ_16410, partial [Woeseia sp.]